MNAEIISIGRELLMGETVDTNASFLAKQLPRLGIDVLWVSQVGDNQSHMVEVLKRAWGRSDLIITTGGLGPTADDLTRESVAELMGETMNVIPELEIVLRERFRRYGMPEMPKSNIKQCTLIPCAQALPNDQGTAPGWWIEKDGRIIVCMPGPPREMHEMWEKEVRPRLLERSKAIIVTRTWKTFGYSEAAVGELAFPLFPGDNPSLGVYAKPDGIQLQLKITADTEKRAQELLAAGEHKIMAALGNSIWGIDDETLETTVGRMLVQKGLTMALVEDYSGGWLTTGFTELPDYPRFFKGGIVAATDAVKNALGIPAPVIEEHGPVSSQVAMAMAEAARKYFGADIGVGITGMDSSPQQGGIVHFAISDGTVRETAVRPRGKQRLTTAVLFELRKLLSET